MTSVSSAGCSAPRLVHSGQLDLTDFMEVSGRRVLSHPAAFVTRVRIVQVLEKKIWLHHSTLLEQHKAKQHQGSSLVTRSL